MGEKGRKADAKNSDNAPTEKPVPSERERRLARAMRENLKRRKSQVRARNSSRHHTESKS